MTLKHLPIGHILAIAALHVAGLGLLWPLMRADPALVGLGLLAYLLGLRHAFDADHILAIDNAVRKLIHQDEDPRGVGFYFSLGHATVVLVLAGGAIATGRFVLALPALRSFGNAFGTLVSGGLLVALGAVNLFVLLAIVDAISRHRRGLSPSPAFDTMLESRSLVGRFARPLFTLVRTAAHAYPIGLVFGLGFDTATEVALLALSAGVAASGANALSLFSLPLLFGAGMTLMDTADGLFMTAAYRWALATPGRKLYYNLLITGVSVVGALSIGALEIAGGLSSSNAVSTIAAWSRTVDSETAGYVFVGLVAAVWSGAYLAMRMRRRRATAP